MTRRPVRPPGATSQRLAQNLRAIRTERGLSTYALTARLKEIGWVIHQGGITRIEQGQRHVDVDDLVALAVALDCSPNRLLLPQDTSGDRVPVIGDIKAADIDLWAWATGDRPLTTRNSTETQVFKIRNAPHRWSQP
jgi:transcriptional regulator with XRE-family HTH domain